MEDRKTASPRHFCSYLLTPSICHCHLTLSPLSSLPMQPGVPPLPPQTALLRAPVHLPPTRPSFLRRRRTSSFSPVIPSAEAADPPAISVAPLRPRPLPTATHSNLPNRNSFVSDQRLSRSFNEASKRTARGSSSACANSKIYVPNLPNTLGQEAPRGVAENGIPPVYLRPGTPQKVLYQTTAMTS
jgi:hypothetical protein